MLYTLNIGLNVKNEQPEGQYVNTVRALEKFYFNDILYFKTVESEYNGLKENTVVISFTSNSEPLYNIERICGMLKQECIALYCHDTGRGKMIYSDSFAGQKLEFDIQYFKF